MTTCSVVVPVYNSEQTLSELADRLAAALTPLCKDFEVLLVNDGSRDRSWEKICELAGKYAWIRGINLMRNFGQHNALLCGVRAARFDVVVTMDDDLQHPPEEIYILLEELAAGYDVVYGIPKKLPHSLWRNIFSRLTKKMLAFVMGIPTVSDIGAFRAFKTDLRRAFSSYRSPQVILDVLLSWGTANFGRVVVHEDPRRVGRSNYSFSKLVSSALFILTGYSTAPLRFASLLGFFMMLLGFFLFIYVVAVYFTAGSLPGFPFLASTISVFSGTQLFALGIIGEYLSRIFDRSMGRPQYVVGKQTFDADGEAA